MIIHSYLRSLLKCIPVFIFLAILSIYIGIGYGNKAYVFSNESVQTLVQSNQQYILFYTSDHGEIIDVGHGIQYGGANQYLIPLMIKSNFDNQYCNFIEQQRNKNGYISGLMNKFLLANMLGYTIDAKKLLAEKNNDRVLHSDGIVYDFMTLPSKP